MKELAIRNEAVLAALELALAGKVEKLYAELSKQSGLPGTRANAPLAFAFADECARRGKASDVLTSKLATLDADFAPGGTSFEFLPMCGVLAVGARGASDPKMRDHAMVLLHEAADDLRYRVREAVTLSLVKIGTACGDELLLRTESWMDGFFHAASVLTALSTQAWLVETHDVELVTQRLADAANLVRGAARSASRYPGYKALLEALRAAPAPLALRHGIRVLEEVKRWITFGDVELREIAIAAVYDEKLKSRFGDAIDAIYKDRDAAIPAPRDGKKVEGPTRKRGAKGRAAHGKRRG